MKISVSVIVPFFNRSKVVSKTIESVLTQTIQDFELIIIDDCSIKSEYNRLIEIIQSYSDERIKVIRLEKNVGGGEARNIGIRESKGDYIAFLDSDDVWVKEKLEKNLINYQDDKNIIVYSKLERISLNNVRNVIPKSEIKNKIGDYLFCENGVIQTSSIFMEKKLALKVMFNPNLPRHQDYDFVLRAENLGLKFQMIDEALVQWIEQNDGGGVKKGGTSKFCSGWIDEYSIYMSRKAIANYNIKILLPILVYEERYKIALELILKNIVLISKYNIKRAVFDILKIPFMPIKKRLKNE
ncbi:glycosyltransferase family 2 protein [Photobacterium leiognathi]|uniref:glycosyltransferase family 2 protein n=1 Tax=Photobacterium leiognathi TaxID=553611 RepID=UPI0029811762|nr:glycosyltransferase family 2 protein [Photobacterium leiognathi]